jgi:hypothetical protein
VAKIYEQSIVIIVSKLAKTNDQGDIELVSEETIAAIEQVAQELLGNDVIVEVERG